jgi:hypothetical protein
MNFNRKILASAIAGLGMTASALVSAQQPGLPMATVDGGSTAATITGGASGNNGATFGNSFSSTAAIDVIGTISVDPADVGQEGALVAVVFVPNLGLFQKVSGGFFLPWNEQIDTLFPYTRKTLSATETVTVFDDLVGEYSNLQGLDFNVFFGYYAGDDITGMAYTGNPISFSIEESNSGGGSAPCDDATTTSGSTFEGKTVCILSGTITEDIHMTANNVYLLDGAVFVGGDNVDSATLSIDAGTRVIAPVGLNFLTINRGSRIDANGTKDNPVVFTYEDEANATPATTGQWGGIILNGNAPVNGCAEGTQLCELEGEGGTGLYGGNNAEDSSGVLNYVVVKYPGQNITEDNELNGIAFQGTGSGTIVSNVQVHGSSDDGIEFFGGSTNAKNLVLTSNEDDSLDWTFGWDGKVQNVVIQQRANTGDRGIEADNNGDDNDAAPRSRPTLANFTMIGKGAAGRGIMLRRGTGANLYNFVVTDFDSYCLDFDDSATFDNGGASATDVSGDLTMVNSLFGCANAFGEDVADPWSIETWFEAQDGNTTGIVTLDGFVNTTDINDLEAAELPGSFFTPVDHIGAVRDDASDWTSGWIFQD